MKQRIKSKIPIYTNPIWDELKKKARKRQAHVILCEGADERVLRAADIVDREKLAHISIIGDESAIAQKAQTLGLHLKTVGCIDPRKSNDVKAVAQRIYDRQKQKGISEQKAQECAYQPAYFGFGLLGLGKADAAVCGAVEMTAVTVRSAMYSLGTAPGHRIVIGIFLVEAPYALHYGLDGGFVFADCGVTPEPSSRMLAHIAKEAADAFSFYFKKEARVAFLSFSTFGSASHERVDKVREAVALTRKQFPHVTIDGEFQLDAALDPGVAAKKGAGSSSVAGKANVLIFPDLDAGNITYKAVQRLGGARTIGPILWGLEKPASDLSRGCTDEDIVHTICAVSAQSPEP